MTSINTNIASCAAVLLIVSIASVQKAYAQNTVIYGRVDLGLRSVKDVRAGNQDTQLRMDDSSRGRFGFRGEEDLGNGLKAFFQLENRFFAYTGMQDSDRLWKDKAWLGVEKSGLGSLRLGRMSSPVNDRGVNGRFEAFDGNSLAGLGGRGAAQVDKWDSTLAVRSASFHGFSASAAYSFRNGQDEKDAFGLQMEYALNAWTISLSWQRDARATVGGTLADTWQTAAVGTSYKTDTFKLYGIVAHSWDIATTDVGRAQTYTVGVGIPTATGEVRTSYQASLQRRMNGANRNGDGQRHRLGLGYHYPLSKQTSVNVSVLHDRYQSNAVGKQSGTGWEVALRKNF